MISLIIIVSIAFYWLLYETYWLTINLIVGKYERYHPKTLIEIALLIYCAVILIGKIKSMMPKSKDQKQKKQHWYSIFKKLLPTKYTALVPMATSKEKK